MEKTNMPIGFFDSGVGGISVLREAVKLMPNENYIYFGDSRNAPYGTRNIEEVKELSFNAVDFLVSKGIKALVVACNTATSAAINDIREKYPDMIVVGIEPALKPAIELNRDGNIIIMATPMTLAEKKFSNLMQKYSNNTSNIKSLPCPGLVELIESGIVEGIEVEDYLRNRLAFYIQNDISAIVLGCTHYPFVKETLGIIVGNDVPIIDGGSGTAKQLKRLLRKSNLINPSIEEGTVEIYNSLNNENMTKLSYELLNR